MKFVYIYIYIYAYAVFPFLYGKVRMFLMSFPPFPSDLSRIQIIKKNIPLLIKNCLILGLAFLRGLIA